MKTRPLNTASLSRKEFERVPKVDNYLYFVYDEIVENGKPKTKVSLYKGRHLICGQLYEAIQGSTFKVGKVYTLPAGSQPVVQNVGAETDVVLNVGFPIGAESTFKIGEVSTLSAGSQPVVTNTGDEKNVILNVKIPADKVLKAGTATRLTADAAPAIAVREDNQDSNLAFIDIGVPASPYMVTENIAIRPTVASNTIAYANHTTSLQGDWLNNDKIFGKREIFKNTTDVPCFCVVKTMPNNDDTDNYSSSDNVIMIPPQGKGIVTHHKTYPVHGLGKSEVYPTLKTVPEIVFDVEFNDTNGTYIDKINGIEVTATALNSMSHTCTKVTVRQRA
ncbi:MAG: hypothetical protein NC324_08640, partial [Bacteroides sp.]|nr:hypothetical protein [Bacteroides sp.]